jgi:hypothetical protein
VPTETEKEGSKEKKERRKEGRKEEKSVTNYEPAFCQVSKGRTQLKLFQNRVLRRIFGPKREEVAGGWRRLHNEELHNLYPSPNILKVIKSRRMRWTEHVARMVVMINTYKIFIGKFEGKKLLGRPRRRWEDNITLDLRKIGWKSVDWMHLAQVRGQWCALVNVVMSLPQKAGDFLTI